MPELRDYKKFSLSLILTEKVIDEKKFIDAKKPTVPLGQYILSGQRNNLSDLFSNE